MLLKKVFKIYKPVEDLMYADSKEFELHINNIQINKNVKFELITKDNCGCYTANDFFNANIFLQKKAIVLGARIDNNPVAYGAAILKGGKSTYFRVLNSDMCFCGLYTYYNYRRQGIMKSLMKELYNRALINENIEVLSLNVRPDNSTAKKLYNGLGFKTIKTVTFLKKWIFKFPYYNI